MLLTEMAVQNVAGLPAKAKVPLKAGLNALVGRDADLARLLRAVLYPQSEDALALAGPNAPRKAAVTIVGKDGHTWRVVRDFDGGRTLLKSDPATREAIKVASEEAEVERALVAGVGLPPWDVFRELFHLPHEMLPSSKDRQVVRGQATLVPGAGELQVTAAEAKVKLPALERELEKAVDFERAQDEVFRLQTRVGELAGSTGQLDELKERLAEAEEQAAAHRRMGEATAGLEAKIRRYPEAQARREGALAELKRKQAEYEHKLTAVPDLSVLGRDQIFLGGLAGGVLCFGLALTLGWTPLFWLDPVGFGVAAFAAFRFVAEVENADHGRRRLVDLGELEKRIQKQYEAETQPVDEAMHRLGARSLADLAARLEERDVVEARKVALEGEIAQLESDPALAKTARDRAALVVQLKEREAFVNAFGFSRSPAEIQREIDLCREALGLTGAASDPLGPAVERAAQVAGLPPPAFVESFRERLGQYLAALTDRRFVGIRPVSPGVCHVVAAGGASGPAGALPVTDRDLIVLAVRLALAERIAAPMKLPIVVDEPSLVVDAPHRALFVKMLKALGATTQVLVRAFDPPPPGVVDHVAKVIAPGEKAA